MFFGTLSVENKYGFIKASKKSCPNYVNLINLFNLHYINSNNQIIFYKSATFDLAPVRFMAFCKIKELANIDTQKKIAQSDEIRSLFEI